MMSDASVMPKAHEKAVGEYGTFEDKSVQQPENRRDHKVYTSRWYVLCVVSMGSIVNNYLWATWGPISQSAKLVYGWNNNTLFWVVNVGNITGLFFVIFGCYLVDVKVAVVSSNVFLALSAATRIITIDKTIATILIAIGQGFKGLATGIMSPISPAVSKTWFHVSERTTATAVSTLSYTVGTTVAFLVGPLTVSMPKMNGTRINFNETDTDLIKEQLKTLNYCSFGVAALLMVCSIIYFPAKPSTAPSTSAATDRHELKDGSLLLIKNPSMWLIGIVYALPIGFFSNWQTMLDVVLSPLGIPQTEVGWISFYGAFGGVVIGLVISRFADIFKRKMKLFIVALYIIAAADFTWFSCMTVDYIPASKASLYVSVIVANIAICSTGPLFMEITCEKSYPVAEGVTAGFLAVIINFGAALFLFIGQYSPLDPVWTNWIIAGVYAAAVPLMALFKPQYKRMDIDMAPESHVTVHT